MTDFDYLIKKPSPLGKDHGCQIVRKLNDATNRGSFEGNVIDVV